MFCKPQVANANSWIYWLKDGMRLLAKRIRWLVALSLGYGLLLYLPHMLWMVFVILAPLLLGLMCLIAHTADIDQGVTHYIQTRPVHIWVRLLGVSAVVLVPMAFLYWALVTVLENMTLESGIFYQTLHYLLENKLWAAMFLVIVILGPLVWFVIPLIVVGKQPFPVAARKAFYAIKRNKFVAPYTLVFGVSMLFFFAVSPILTTPWLALFGSSMYVSHRHIWYEKGNSDPLKVKIAAESR